jgi:hypothetical protein
MYTTLAILQAIPAAGTIYAFKAWNLYNTCDFLTKECTPGYYQMGQIVSALAPILRNVVFFAGVFLVCLWLQLIALVYHYSVDKFAKPPVIATHIGVVGALSLLLCFMLMQSAMNKYGEGKRNSVWGQPMTKQLLAGYVVPNLTFGYLHYQRDTVASKVPSLRQYGIV